MKPYDKLTIVRNRVRANELRAFRELVETYFEQVGYAADDVPVEWNVAQAARAEINRMLPRMVQVVEAARLGRSPTMATDPGPGVGNAAVLRDIFTARDADGLEQEILDVIDMAIGVYEASRHTALARTFNPLHYLVTALSFVASIPRRTLRALGFGRRPGSAPRLQSEDVARLEAVAARFADAERSMETRFATIRDRQAQRTAEHSRQLAELAERLDFTERVLAQQDVMHRLKAPDESDAATPV